MGWPLWVKILGCSLWSRSGMLWFTQSEHPMLTSLTVKLFLKISNLCDHDTLTSRTGRTDRQSTLL